MGVGVYVYSVVWASMLSFITIGCKEFCIIFAVCTGVVGVKGRREAAVRYHARVALQAPRKMTYIRTGRAQDLIFHRVPPGQSWGPMQGAPCTSMVQWFHRWQSAHS